MTRSRPASLPAAPAVRPERRAAGAGRVSVLLPVYNGGAVLDRAVDSLSRQTLTAWECLALDDGSTDDTWARLTRGAERDRRIRPVRLARAGIAAALNAGLRLAGESTPPAPYVARLDADDECHPERLARQTAFLDAHPEVGVVGCRVRFGGDSAHAGGFARHVDWLNGLLTPEAIALARFRDSPLAHPSVVFRRSLADACGAYAEGAVPEDYELWLRWMDAGVRMAKLPETLLTWNDPPDRLTRTHGNYSEEAFARVRADYLARWLIRHPAAFAGDGRPEVLVWGAGRVSRRRALPLEARGVAIRAWVDIDPHKIGNRVDGKPVIGREALPPPGRGRVLVFLSARGAAEEAAAWLEGRGYAQGEDFWLCS